MKTDYQVTENITQFLMTELGNLNKSYVGKLPKAKQLELFNHYFGRGEIIINPSRETVSHSIKVSFGQDYDITAIMNFDGTFQFNNR